MVSSRSIRSLSSRRFDSRCSSVQSSGIGVIAKKAFWPRSSGPGDESIAPPNARRKTGVQRISSGSSARPTRSRSRQNASIRAFSSRQKSSRSSAFGCFAAMASRTPRTSAPSSAGIGSPGRQSGHRSPAIRIISVRTAWYSRSARGQDPLRGQRLGAHRVAHLGGEQLRPQPALALARGEDDLAQVGPRTRRGPRGPSRPPRAAGAGPRRRSARSGPRPRRHRAPR